MKQFSFPKSARLLTGADFRAVLARRLCAYDKLLTVCMAENTRAFPRLGISVSKSVGRAVLRNRLKRLLRESFRLNRHRLPQNFDYVVMISKDLIFLLKSAPRNGHDNALRKDIISKITLERVSASFLNLIERIDSRLNNN